MERDKFLHDLNAPINNLKMLIMILEKTDLDKVKILEHLKKILLQNENNHEEIIKLMDSLKLF